MATTTAGAFDDFNTTITPTKATWDKVYARRDVVVSAVKSAFPATSDMSYQSHKIIGSLGRNTASNPVADIDLLVHLHVDPELWEKSYRYNSSDFLYRVRDKLNGSSSVRKVGARGQAVRLFYQDGLIVDVAAVEKYTGGGYGIPDGSGGWLTTDPLQHESYLNQRNNDLDGHLKKVIRFAKKWNAAHSSRLSSFHLEMMVARTFASMSGDSRKALQLFFDYNHYNLSVQDPAGYSGDLSSYLTSSNRDAVNASLASARDRANLALAAERDGDHRESIRLWRIVLGGDFPTYG
ncbi:SMODS domain-containing nucleotidyltransferase [Streptomyces cucumeris]|uniref:SMODS domain-containing nucleotidyltransferase n=1 Tax=Streptomyces cucumeris TaxID=2962890 RepID=UPI003D738A64